MKLRALSKRTRIILAVLLVALLFFWFCLPSNLFTQPYSFILLDKNEKLLQAKIAADGQWRFPEREDIPEKFAKALITFEDKRFYHHPGIDPMALGRAIRQDISARKVVSGGSTISMQVIRLSRKQSRTFFQKIIEMIMAVRMEITYSKKEILALYANHAPFGGNVVGLNAAAWRYFGRDASQLSWSEAASLAILPNSPAMVRPDRNRKLLEEKRNRLLNAMQEKGIIDKQTCELAKLEPIPDKPLPLPDLAPHLLSSLIAGKLNQKRNPSPLIYSTIDAQLQQRVNQLLFRAHENFTANGINNAAALVLEVETGNVLAYAGNVYRPDKKDFDSYVDVIPAERSPGSTLKPFLYAAMLQDGLILPNTLIADIPTQVAGYAPQNFDLGYDGAVPASKALARSLNVPAVRMLQQFRIERFYDVLKNYGVTTLHKPSSYYGLSLILGGGESSLWELSGMYATLARQLNHFSLYNGRYDARDVHMPKVLKGEREKKPDWSTLPAESILGAGAIYSTFNAMQEVMRPGDEVLWSQFSSSKRIAWKTGTSFGFRDGWAIGITPKNVVAVWVGNADGEGRPGLIGVQTAAPVMFEIFKLLPATNWFEIPYDDMQYVSVCRESGFLATEICNAEDSVLVPRSGLHSSPCPYHQLIHLDATDRHRVTAECEPTDKMHHVSWFVLPPAMEWYYKNHNPLYKTLPPWRSDCLAYASNSSPVMEMIYPKRSNTIYIPVELDGTTGKCVFEVAHRNKSAVIYWHMDENYIGATHNLHQMAMNPSTGKHTLVLVDENGNRLEQFFEILRR